MIDTSIDECANLVNKKPASWVGYGVEGECSFGDSFEFCNLIFHELGAVIAEKFGKYIHPDRAFYE